MHWNGNTWSVVPSPDGGSAVTALSANDAWVVGRLTLHWNGTEWSVVPGPNVRSLNGIP